VAGRAVGEEDYSHGNHDPHIQKETDYLDRKRRSISTRDEAKRGRR